jgi:CDP-glycerol glycerophosphotransferase (TagB/SpsB family)
MTLYFDTLHLYYLTQYLPVYRELERRGIRAVFIFYRNGATDKIVAQIIEKEQLPAIWVDSVNQAAACYLKDEPDWVVFGNSFSPLAQLHPGTKTAQLYHAIGMKNDVYQKGLMEMDIRFTEGPHYTEVLERLFPGRPMLEVGYAKLDPLFGPKPDRPEIDFDRIGLPADQPTLLYAPTFYPSSIEMMPDDLPAHFSDYNLIVKPHMFTFSKARYKKQVKKLKGWAAYANCVVTDPFLFNLLPYMNSADLMISDASSALFEFAAMDKPVIWCDFLKLRWTYRGIFRYRFKRRMDQRIYQYADIGKHASGFDTLRDCVLHQLQHIEEFQGKRREYTARLIGVTDGFVSKRIVDYFETVKKP